MLNQPKLPDSTCTCPLEEIFGNVEEEALKKIHTIKVTNTYQRGQNFFLQGTPVLGIFVIESGKVKLFKRSHDARETIIRFAGKGDILGDSSVFGNETHTLTAEALEDTVVCFLDKHFLEDSFSKFPSFSRKLMYKLSEEMRGAEEHILSMSQKTVRERNAELILRLIKKFGVHEEKGFKLDLRVSREELASMAGTVHETIIRLLSELKEDGIIEQHGRYIYVLNQQELQKLANLPDQ